MGLPKDIPNFYDLGLFKKSKYIYSFLNANCKCDHNDNIIEF